MSAASDANETARDFATEFARESFEGAAARLTDAGRENVVNSFPEGFGDQDMDVEDALERYWWGLYGQYGDFEDIGDVTVEAGEDGEDGENVEGGESGEDGEGNEVAVELVFVDGNETATVEVGEGGVADLSFSPAYEAPTYVDPEVFSERDVTVDAGDVELSGVLAVPEGDEPFPGVLLVHGAGIHDPDGTDGASKILKDFAHGLASDGIASLRYQKRLDEHEIDDENYTLDRVVTDDAVAAVDELAGADEVDADSVFVAGHSQGGMAAPRIADRHGGVAGVVVLDGLADSTHDPDDLAFLRYEFEWDGDLSEEQEAELERERETVRRLAEGDYDDDETVWGQPGIWHRSVRNYDPAGTASSLDAPVFVLKTGRADEEIQPELVTWLHGEFEKWRDADLGDGSHVEFYRDVGHYFQDGPAPMTFHHLYFGGNVAGYVVEDVAAWVHDIVRE